MRHRAPPSTEGLSPTSLLVGRIREGRGFTLVELLITVAVLAILIAIAAPNMSDVIGKRRVIGAAEAVYSQLQFARSEAVKQSQSISVVFTTTAPWAVAVAGNATVAGGDYPGVTIAASNGTTVTFDGVRGLMSVPASEEVITVSLGSKYQMQVKIGVLGRVLICSPAGSTQVGGYAAC